MKIGLSMRVVEAPSYQERRDALAQDWWTLCDALAIEPVAIPNTLEHPARYAERLELDGLILTGGNDLGDAPERDETERALLGWAIEKKVPVFGVCRGLQMINHFFDGGVSSVIAASTPLEDRHVATTHVVKVVDEAWMPLFGKEEVWVNSFHDAGVLVTELGPDLRATALTKYEVLVEA